MANDIAVATSATQLAVNSRRLFNAECGMLTWEPEGGIAALMQSSAAEFVSF
jgi:hypothetical protein